MVVYVWIAGEPHPTTRTRSARRRYKREERSMMSTWMRGNGGMPSLKSVAMLVVTGFILGTVTLYAMHMSMALGQHIGLLVLLLIFLGYGAFGVLCGIRLERGLTAIMCTTYGMSSALILFLILIFASYIFGWSMRTWDLFAW